MKIIKRSGEPIKFYFNGVLEIEEPYESVDFAKKVNKFLENRGFQKHYNINGSIVTV